MEASTEAAVTLALCAGVTLFIDTGGEMTPHIFPLIIYFHFVPFFSVYVCACYYVAELLCHKH